MRIPCPYCGERDILEFAYRGDAGKMRPGGADAGPGAMLDYVYLRENLAGLHREHWYHAQGCRAWLVVTRDTRTHEIKSAAPARAIAPRR